MLPVGRILRLARAAVHAALGRVAYRLGMPARARRHFERVLLLRGASFAAYVHLGRIAFDHGDYSGWRREFEHARRTDPVRFSRLRHPLELFEPRLAGTRYDAVDELDGFEGTDARATWRALRPFGANARRDTLPTDGFGRGTDLPLAPDFDPLLPGQQLDERQPAPSHPDRPAETPPPRRADAPLHDVDLPDATLRHDDFASDAERRRFQLRRPIDRREIARCDLDDLSRRLSG
ncbi:MAG: tetratricopeptide repeat protein [Planctomycetes bacterium]|nr:tetratricopeptide repeat protein [Planctomycetota bacterium]